MENPEPLISVIIPFFNSQEFLRETFESVISQEYSNWEIILIDDGSTDNSIEIAKEYVQKYPARIFCYQHEGHKNKGAAAGRNLGLKKAKGELVALLDADDVWLPQKLKKQVEIFRQNPQISMVCESTKYWYSWSNSKRKDVVVKVGANTEQVFQPIELVKKLYPLGSGAAPCTCSLLIKTSVLKKFNGFEESFVENSQVFEDQAFLIKIYLSETVYISSLCNNLYRQRPGSVMQITKSQEDFLKARYFFLEWLVDYLEKQEINNPEIDRLMRRAFLPYKFPLTAKILRRIRFFWNILFRKFQT